jgi:gliding motility-associated-like protein
LWDFGDGTTSTIENPAHTYSAPGDYNVTFKISNALGCKDTTTRSVKVYQEPTANIVFPASFCNSLTSPQPVNLTGTNLYTGGVFSAPVGLNINATTGAIIPNKSTPGNYLVTYTIPTANGCTVPPATTKVSITLLPTAFINYPNLPYCGNVTSPQSVSLTGTGAYTGGTFSSTSGLTIDGKTGAVTPSTSTTGNYVVTYSVPAVGGCNAFQVTTNVVVNSFPTAAISYLGTPFCTSLNTLQAVTLTGTYSYTGGVFSAPAGLSIDSVTGKVNPGISKPGTYIVTYVIPAIVNCNLTPATTSVTITGLPSAVISYNSPFCRDVSAPQPVSLAGTLAFSGGRFTSAAGLVLDTLTGAITPSASKAGTYLITYTIPASGGCSVVPVTTSVIINPLPEPILANGDICLDPLGNLARSFTFESGLADKDFAFQWFFNGVISKGAIQSTYTATEIGEYSVIATNILTGCVSTQIYATVVSAQMASDFIMSVNDTFTENNILTVVVNGGTGPFFFQLDNESFQNSNVFHQLSSGIHIVSIKDDTNCTVISKQVTIMGYPKFFTPNNDGFNDYWNISYYNNFPQAHIHIFDRYGKLIKEIAPLGSGWDGTYDGNLLPAADYWFIVNFKEFNLKGELESKMFKSHFSLKR